MTIHIHLINTKLLGTKQEAQLLQRSHNASCRWILRQVTLRHSKWHHWVKKSPLEFHCIYVCISFRFWDIQRQIIVRPWNLG